ncbi:hypothetical protein PTTG_02837 [Puccinia triticina 1-1 BBBD Race 1]|uniref:SAGA-associated factor 11 n=1 Tax=Puccinia triticina (isolate 1-1 / race 1 (BBBD)) TaxID=630390 RepID=A0A180GKB4_PUCT1|nr:hypothetical protein PTTG_02837 [Puccinia triticina 1-1 BBBD Race 1]WAR52434.1 hypothetical protein PtB15_1B876 [Puccinia triticina]
MTQSNNNFHNNPPPHEPYEKTEQYNTAEETSPYYHQPAPLDASNESPLTQDNEIGMLVESIFNGLLEEMIWKISVLEFKRARNFRIFSAEQELYANERKNCNDKNNPEPVHDCPVCGREVSAARFAPHLSKCLGIGGRGQAAKKGVRSELSESESVAKGSSHTPSDFPGRNRTGGNMKRRGRPPKKLPVVPLSAAENDALLSNAINNATQRLHLQGIGMSKPSPPVPHPLSQSHVATPSLPKFKKKKDKQDRTRNRSRNSSQASSSSDSEEEGVGDGEEEGEEQEGEEGEDDHQSFTPAGRIDDENEASGQRRGISENPSISPASVAPVTPAVPTTVLPRPVLKRRSSSQADSTDGSDSD